MINTYVSKGDSWNIITSTANNVNCVNTWDPSKINWSDYTIAPVEITWTGCDPAWMGTLPNAAAPATLPGTVQTFDTTIGASWVDAQYHNFTKPAGIRPDVLMGFFSQYLHALLFVTEESTYTVPFMERVGLIWIQHELNKWTAYDRNEFYEFIDNPDATIFVGKSLNKREIHKRMSEAKDE